MNEPRSRVASQSICILLCCTLIVPGCVSSGRCKKGNCDDGYGVLIEEDGTVYTGEFKDGLYQGKGEIKRPNGTKG